MHSELKIKRKDISMILWSLPFVLFIIAFSYVPLFGWIYALFDFRPGIPLFQNTFEGLGNFKEIFSSTGEVYGILINTLGMNFLNLILSPLPIIFAIMLNEIKHPGFKKISQTITTIPNFVSWLVVYAVAFALFSSEGMVNQALAALHSSITVDFLTNADKTWFFQAILTLWKTLGWNAIIYIAAIAGIDNELYDAAKVDGASFLSQVRHITIPGVLPTFIVLMLLSIANMLSSNFDQYFVFYNSIISSKIEVIDYYSYRMGIINSDYSLGAAISVLKSIISLVLLFSVNGLSKKLRGESII